MAVSEGILITTAVKVLSPALKDIYDKSKGAIQTKFKVLTALPGIKKVAKAVAAVEKVKTIWEPEKDLSLLKFFYAAKVKVEDKNIKIDSIKDLPNKNIVIQGIVGQGKSILLRYLTIQELTEKGSGRIPVFLELRTLSESKNLKTAIFNTLDKMGIDIDDEVFDHLADSGKMVLLLDAFDEVEDKIRKQVFNDIEDLAKKYDQLQIIITTRPSDEIQKSAFFQVLVISTLSQSDYLPFLRKLNLSINKANEIINVIHNSPSNISSLINTPLMLTLVVIVYQYENEIPSDLPEFFQRLFQVVFSRHDNLKGGFERKHHSGLTERQLVTLFESFCFMVIQHGFSRSLNFEQFEVAFNNAKKYTTNCDCELEKFKKDITKVACLMLEEGLDTTTFLHKNIMEYFAAAFIKRSSENIAKKFYESVKVNNRDWKEVLRFLNKIDSYRFAKYYIIPKHEDFLSKYGEFEELDNNKLENLLSSIFPTEKMVYAETGETPGLYRLISLGPLQYNGVIEPEAIVQDYFLRFINKFVLQSLSKETFTESNVPVQLDTIDSMRGYKHANAKNKPSINIFTFKFYHMARYDEKIVEHFKECIHAITEELIKYKVIVDSEDSKELIFT